MILDIDSTPSYIDLEEVCLQFSGLVFDSVNKRVYLKSCVQSIKLRSILVFGEHRLVALLDGRNDDVAHAVFGMVLGSD